MVNLILFLWLIYIMMFIHDFYFTCRVFPLKRAAEEKAQAAQAAAANSFKSMLQEKGDIAVSSRWSRVGAFYSLFDAQKSMHPDNELVDVFSINFLDSFSVGACCR